MKFNPRVIWSLAFMLASLAVSGQRTINGSVWEKSEKKEVPLTGANVYWLHDISVSAMTDSAGQFSILADSMPARLVVSYVGFMNDTVTVSGTGNVRVVLKSSVELKEVNITARNEAVMVSTMSVINSEKITQRELLKAACCNLSEAFETNPTITVAYRDAVTGAKEIRLLGLSGIYSQLLTENIPNMRGLASSYGLTYIPGPWMESIQITKGTGSVLNGYESTTGQINVEFKKPHEEKTPRFFLNLFSDNFGSNEINTFYKKSFGKWSGILMAHGRYMDNNIDRNGDQFMDLPNNKQFNIYNRWQYHSGKKLESQIGVRFLVDEIRGGQVQDADTGNMKLYMTAVSSRRAEVFGKLGIVFPERPLKSIGNIVQVTFHDMNSEFGLTRYNADQRTFLYQGMYQNFIGQRNHQYIIGVSYRYDELNQRFFPLPDRIVEHLPGVFAEYTYSYLDKLTVVAGVRQDVRNNNEPIFTPRLHAKYNFNENTIIRISGGRSYRRPFAIAENLSVLATARQVVFTEAVRPEKAWNYGFNFTKKYRLNGREGSFLIDLYRTHFINQLIVDTYTSNALITFYNLNGESYSNSLQATLNYELIDRLELRLAYKMEDVHSTYGGILQRQPMVPRDRALANIAYANKNEHWKFDFTTIWEGQKPLQNVYSDANTRRKSPSFFIMHFQVTKEFRKFDLYAGSENLLDFKQTDPVLNADHPFHAGFDATNVWGPIAGRRIYAGIRYSIK